MLKIFVEEEYGYAYYSFTYKGTKKDLLKDWIENNLPLRRCLCGVTIKGGSTAFKALSLNKQISECLSNSDAILRIEMDHDDGLYFKDEFYPDLYHPYSSYYNEHTGLNIPVFIIKYKNGNMEIDFWSIIEENIEFTNDHFLEIVSIESKSIPLEDWQKIVNIESILGSQSKELSDILKIILNICYRATSMYEKIDVLEESRHDWAIICIRNFEIPNLNKSCPDEIIEAGFRKSIARTINNFPHNSAEKLFLLATYADSLLEKIDKHVGDKEINKIRLHLLEKVQKIFQNRNYKPQSELGKILYEHKDFMFIYILEKIWNIWFNMQEQAALEILQEST